MTINPNLDPETKTHLLKFLIWSCLCIQLELEITHVGNFFGSRGVVYCCFQSRVKYETHSSQPGWSEASTRGWQPSHLQLKLDLWRHRCVEKPISRKCDELCKCYSANAWCSLVFHQVQLSSTIPCTCRKHPLVVCIPWKAGYTRCSAWNGEPLISAV